MSELEKRLRSGFAKLNKDDTISVVIVNFQEMICKLITTGKDFILVRRFRWMGKVKYELIHHWNQRPFFVNQYWHDELNYVDYSDVFRLGEGYYLIETGTDNSDGEEFLLLENFVQWVSLEDIEGRFADDLLD